MQFIAKYKKEIQIILEALIIIFGMLLDWGFELILFYIALDLIAKFLLSVLKWRKLLQEREILPSVKRKQFLLGIGYVIILTGSLFMLVSLVNPNVFIAADPSGNMDVSAEWNNNFNLMIDAAGNQLWLIPLVLVVVLTQYWTEFLKGMEFRIVETKGFFLRRLAEISPFIVVPSGLMAFGITDEIPILLILTVSKIAVEYPVLKLEQRLMKENLTKGY